MSCAPRWRHCRRSGKPRSSRPPKPAAGARQGRPGLARLTRLVTQLLSLSKLDHLTQRTAGEPIDWHAVIEQVFNEILVFADRRQVELACEWPADGAAPLPLQGDATLLAAMLRNLVDNALRHSPAQSQVTVRLGTDAIEVIDEGSGVEAEHLARLGDRFYRPPGDNEPGSGLGLSIVRRIAELHGLRVHWANREDRRGFKVRLSRAPA